MESILHPPNSRDVSRCSKQIDHAQHASLLSNGVCCMRISRLRGVIFRDHQKIEVLLTVADEILLRG